MASVCGSTLALMDGGVPIKSPIAGIAMGMVMDEASGEYKILSDIQGLEDASGDMDFKITGNKEGITALQMDIKVKGLKLELLAEALQQAKIGRKFILSAMHEAISEPRKTFSEFAPLIITVKINPKDIGAVIGKGGEVIQDLCKTFNAEIDIDDDGIVLISGQKEQAEQVKKAIEAIVYEPQAGDVFTGCKVKTLKDFGAFVEFMPGKDAMVHISEIAEERVENINDYLKEGQIVNVKYLGLDKAGRQRFSIKATEQN
jgi:polyribonucleotide nucleotidyltransferase